MKVTIVGRTRMRGGLCIGGMTDDAQSLRVQPQAGHAHPENAQYQIADVWEIPLTPIPDLRPPHVEDMRLTGPGQQLDRIADMGAWLMERVSPWRGSADSVFDEAIQRKGSGRAFVGAADIPGGSVGFWIPDRPLLRSVSGDREHYTYTDHDGAEWRFSYAGVAATLKLIPAGTLVRVSLARWWSPPDSDDPEACYAQVSGWFHLVPGRANTPAADVPTEQRNVV